MNGCFRMKPNMLKRPIAYKINNFKKSQLCDLNPNISHGYKSWTRHMSGVDTDLQCNVTDFQNNDVGVRALQYHRNKQNIGWVCGNPAWCGDEERSSPQLPREGANRGGGAGPRRCHWSPAAPHTGVSAGPSRCNLSPRTQHYRPKYNSTIYSRSTRTRYSLAPILRRETYYGNINWPTVEQIRLVR